MRGPLGSFLLVLLLAFAGCAAPATTSPTPAPTEPAPLAKGVSSMEVSDTGVCPGVAPDDCTSYSPGWGPLTLTNATSGTLVATWNASADGWTSLHVRVTDEGTTISGPYRVNANTVAEGTGPSPLRIELRDVPAAKYHVSLQPTGRVMGPSTQYVNWVLLPAR